MPVFTSAIKTWGETKSARLSWKTAHNRYIYERQARAIATRHNFRGRPIQYRKPNSFKFNNGVPSPLDPRTLAHVLRSGGKMFIN